MMENYAYLEWYIFKTMEETHISVEEISTYNLHCLCDDKKEELGYWEAIKIMYTYKTEEYEK
jgi:hypothetical protein